MPRKRFTPEQIIQKLREVEVLTASGIPVPPAVREISVTHQTYYRWRKEYGGLRLDQAKRLKELEKELDIPILKEARAIDSKTSKPAQRRRTVERVCDTLHIAQRRVCQDMDERWSTGKRYLDMALLREQYLETLKLEINDGEIMARAS
jgi:hypothetical protein